jgi:hypothetical protein
MIKEPVAVDHAWVVLKWKPALTARYEPAAAESDE